MKKKFTMNDARGARILLASASPRRRELLAKMGLRFTVCPADVCEDVPAGTHPRDAVKLLARRKANALLGSDASRGAIVIAADTLVADGDTALGKPQDTEDAYRMIASLSGKAHAVYTGVAVAWHGKLLVRSDATKVFMRPYDAREARAYAETGEGLDKAGAYGIQGLGGALVDHIDGSFDNVMGFPTALANEMLCELIPPMPDTDAIVAALKERYPEAVCALEYGNDPWRLLVMGRLSAQCTDARVNIVCRELFRVFPTAEAMADGDLAVIEEIVRPCGFFRHKAAEIRDASHRLVDVYHGVLPDTMEELLTFPGVGRKIANLLLGDVYHRPAVVADTHCIRVCGRLGYYDESVDDPALVEKFLTPVLPPEESADFCHRIVSFGREICTARSPKCEVCPIGARGLCRHHGEATDA